MKAVVHDRYGPPEVLRLADIDQPVPGDDEVLVRVRATTVNRTDCGFRSGKPFIVRPFSGLTRPKRPVLGTELAGVVEAVGSAVTEFAVGDEVFGVNADKFGAHAEYIRMREKDPLAKKPAGISFEEAAAVCDGVILALAMLRAAGLEKGQRVLVYGASGSIGTAAVQLARHFETEVTAVCNTKNVDLVRSLGADVVIDYTQEEFIRDGDQYDIVFDAVGKSSFGHCKPALNRGGRFVATDFGPKVQNPFLALFTWLPAKFGTRRVLFPIPRYRKADVLFLRDLIEEGRYRAVVDRTYPLEEVVEATRYVETEQKTGNVVITP